MSDYGYLLNWHVAAAVLSGVFAVVAMYPYIRDVLRRGETKPNAVSFGLWAVLGIIAVIAQFKAGASWSVVIVILMTANCLIIAALALAGYGYREYGMLDFMCLALAILAIVGWQLTGQPVLAIALSVVADLFAAIPTIVKAYKVPKSEHVLGWLLITIASFFGVMSTEILDAANLLYPVYALLMNGTILSLAFFGRRKAR